jgi:hypothetical protein
LFVHSISKPDSIGPADDGCGTPAKPDEKPRQRPYWEQYFELVKVQDAHDRRECRDQNGSDPWACENCNCTERLEHKLATVGDPFLKTLRGG